MESSSDLSELSSDLSSLGSRSPSPYPAAYPSPQSSQNCDAGVISSQQTTSLKRPSITEGDPPRKKRKSEGAKPRTTEHLDLRTSGAVNAADQSEQVKLLLRVLKDRRKIVVVAGAGISTSAGIPDFRSSNGLFNTLRSENKLKASGKHLFDASVYQTDSSTSSFHDMVRTLSDLVKDAPPTEFHQMLATLAQEGRLLRLYTQNVDGIDTSLPPLKTEVPLDPKGPWPRTIQLHGSLEKMVCSKCNTLSPFNGSLFNGPYPPPCGECIKTDEIRTDHAGKRSHGIGRLRPRMVLYNEHNPDEEAIGRVVTADLRARPDALIVVGTSLEIPGVKRIVKEMCGVVRGRKNGLAVWINRSPPPMVNGFEDCWDLVVAGDCDRVAEKADMRRWDEPPREGVLVTETEAQEAKEKDGIVQVVVASPKKPQRPPPGLMTPAESPKMRPSDQPKITLKIQIKAALKDSKPSSRSSSKAPKKTSLKTTTKGVKTKKIIHKDPNAKAMADLTGTFKITKNNSASGTSKLGRPKSMKMDPMQLTNRDTSTPMHPISPQSARSNGPVLNPAPEIATTIISRSTPEETDLPSPEIKGRLKRLSEEIVTPRGNTPPDMRRLLN